MDDKTRIGGGWFDDKTLISDPPAETTVVIEQNAPPPSTKPPMDSATKVGIIDSSILRQIRTPEPPRPPPPEPTRIANEHPTMFRKSFATKLPLATKFAFEMPPEVKSNKRAPFARVAVISKSLSPGFRMALFGFLAFGCGMALMVLLQKKPEAQAAPIQEVPKKAMGVAANAATPPAPKASLVGDDSSLPLPKESALIADVLAGKFEVAKHGYARLAKGVSDANAFNAAAEILEQKIRRQCKDGMNGYGKPCTTSFAR